jgi:hypothetical protein
MRLWLVLALSFYLICLKGSRNIPQSLREACRGQVHQVSAWSALGLSLGGLKLPSACAASAEEPFKFLMGRALGSDAMRYSPGVLSADVEYPKWFAGEWNVESTTASVNAPLGINAFGGASAWEAAQKDIGNTLKYKSKFFGEGAVIADRLFNVKAIASVAMGKGAVLGIEGDRSIPKTNDREYYNGLAARMYVAITPDRSQGDIFDCSLVTSDRCFAAESAGGFVAVEKVIQTISRRMDLLASQPTAPRIKEIETISLYKPTSSEDSIEAVQRTATFLSPTEQSARYRQLVAENPRVATTAVDIRTYNLRYSRVSS